MKITVDTIAPTSDSLWLGLRVEYSENGPVRFIKAQLDDDVLDWATMTALIGWLTRQTNRHLDRERELEEMDPLF